MQEQAGRTQGTNQNYRGWQSDVIVDLIKRYGFPYITLNPGASFRGLHDSLVNYGGNEPPMMLCQHEEIAVQIAHGYAKATGKPMAVILHDLVGLLHACMAIYYAYIDRVPIFIIGATGPMDEAKRRPHIDWTHTALVQGNAVRDYVKWDYQPTSIEGVPESFARAYSIMTTEPQGPVYMCYDAALQEEPLDARGAAAAGRAPRRRRRRWRPIRRRSQRSPTSSSPPSIPMLLAEYAGRRAGGFESIVALAETDRRRGVGRQQRAQFPQQASALPQHGQGVAAAHRSGGRPRRARTGRSSSPSSTMPCARASTITPPSCDFVEIGFGEINISKWAMDYCRMQPCSVRALGDTALGIPELTRICKERIAADAQARAPHRRAQGGDRQAPRRGLGEVAGGSAQELGRLADHLLTPRAGDLGGDQARGLGAHRQQSQAAGAQALGLRQALSPSRRRARHRDPDRHLARRRARAQGQGPRGGRHPARRRPDVRRRRALGRRQVRNPDAGGDAQQPRLLQRLGAPDPHGEAARHRRGARRISAWTCSGRSPISPRSRARWAVTAKARSTSRRTSGRRSSARSPR